jgi:uncharacterized protein
MSTWLGSACVLNLRTIGEQRFKINSSHVNEQGLIIAAIDYLPIEDDAAIPLDMTRCTKTIEQVISELVDTEPDAMKRVLEPPFLLTSASWVSHRLCEILPFGPSSKQLMLELNDPLQRLSIVNQVLQKHSDAINER